VGYFCSRPLLLSILIGSSSILYGQSATASLSGTVADSSGAYAPGVSVSATHAATGLKSSAVTNSGGGFTIPLLQPGKYIVTTEHPGFAAAEIKDVVLEVGDRVALQIKLTRGYDYRLAAFDRTHVFVVNYVYDVPKAARFVGGSLMARLILDNWQVSGISQYYSGTPYELGMAIHGVNSGQTILGSYSYTPMLYRYGGAAGPSGGLQINPNAYYAPPIGSIGPYPRTTLRGPGFVNNDVSVLRIFHWAKSRCGACNCDSRCSMRLTTPNSTALIARRS
jgi:Carboxypeptidase regulatory-like domain